jgi:hypothetical protein
VVVVAAAVSFCFYLPARPSLLALARCSKGIAGRVKGREREEWTVDTAAAWLGLADVQLGIFAACAPARSGMCHAAEIAQFILLED